jgi:hypothetical protein
LKRVGVDNIVMLPHRDWTPYADTLVVELPEDHSKRQELTALMKEVGRPDEYRVDPGNKLHEQLSGVRGQSFVRLRWD